MRPREGDAVSALEAGGVVTGMVGDGITTRPRWPPPTVSFAIGAGAESPSKRRTSRSCAPTRAVVDAILLSRATLAKIRRPFFASPTTCWAFPRRRWAG